MSPHISKHGCFARSNPLAYKHIISIPYDFRFINPEQVLRLFFFEVQLSDSTRSIGYLQKLVFIVPNPFFFLLPLHCSSPRKHCWCKQKELLRHLNHLSKGSLDGQLGLGIILILLIPMPILHSRFNPFTKSLATFSSSPSWLK